MLTLLSFKLDVNIINDYSLIEINHQKLIIKN